MKKSRHGSTTPKESGEATPKIAYVFHNAIGVAIICVLGTNFVATHKAWKFGDIRGIWPK
jgi:hypothetical protein